MRLSMISRIIKDEVCVIDRSRRLRWITQTEACRGLNNSRYHAKTESNNCLLYIQKQVANNNISGIDKHLMQKYETFVACNNIFKTIKRQ